MSNEIMLASLLVVEVNMATKCRVKSVGVSVAVQVKRNTKYQVTYEQCHVFTNKIFLYFQYHSSYSELGNQKGGNNKVN